MQYTEENLRKKLNVFNPDLIKEILSNDYLKKFDAGTVLVRESQYVKVIPFVLSGLVKVFTRYEDRELLIYYIKPSESCIMSFSSGLSNQPSRIFAITEEESEILTLPVQTVSEWIRKYPEFNDLYFQQYNQRYIELIDTLQHVFFDKLEKRLYDYLKERSRLTNSNPLKISHREIAKDLGTAREVISRVMKKLESDGHVTQEGNSIKLTGGD